jgi:hypothetical protein
MGNQYKNPEIIKTCRFRHQDEIYNKKNDRNPTQTSERPLTASPVPSTSRSSPSIRLLRRFGRVIGLPSPIVARIVGLANGRVPLCEIGDDATDPVAEEAIGTGMGARDEEPERGIYIGDSDVWFSRK